MGGGCSLWAVKQSRRNGSRICKGLDPCEWQADLGDIVRILAEVRPPCHVLGGHCGVCLGNSTFICHSEINKGM